MPLHNHLCYAREKLDIYSVLVFDIGRSHSIQTKTDPGESYNYVTDSPIGVYRCKVLDLEKLISTPEDLQEFKKMIYFKHVFFLA